MRDSPARPVSPECLSYRLSGGASLWQIPRMIELHIFTNSTAFHSPSTGLIERAAQSFAITFGQIETTVWCDRHPNEQQAPEYVAALRKRFPRVVESDSLSDGYLRAVRGSESDFLFMLEHDWEFLEIPVTLEDLCVQVEESELTHLRFNKRPNRALFWDKWLKQEQGSRFAFCRTPCVSNNPHVIHRRRYLDTAMPYVRHLPGARGLEERLSNRSIAAAVYGPIDLAPTIRHLNGRRG